MVMDDGLDRPGADPGSIGEGEPTAELPLDPLDILTSIGEVVYDWDIASDRLVWGVNVRDVLGLERKERLGTGRAFAAFVEPGSGLSRHEAITGSSATDPGSGVPYRTRYMLRPRSDRLLSIEDAGRWFAGLDGRPASAHGVLRVDPVAIEAADAGQIHGQAHGQAHGQVHGQGRGLVCDRSKIIADLAAEVREATRVGRRMTLMVASIEQLTRFNEVLGYEAADAIIEAVVARLSAAMRRRDRLTRYAGNRFTALLMSCSAEQAEIAARRFAKAVESVPVAAGASMVGVKIRIGAALVPDHGTDAAQLLRRAEEALAEAKRRGGGFVLYSPRLGREASRRSEQASGLDLVSALNERRVRIARQPIIEAHSRQIAFEEVLMRIERPNGGLANASEVVPAAERLGLVRLVDHRVLQLAVDCLAREPGTRLAINVSPLTLQDPDWLPAFAAHLGARPGVGDRLIVEITETAALGNAAVITACLDAMKAFGVAIAIDDFGAGHTSFKHLRNFPVDIVKIDGAFVQNLTRSTDDRFFVRTLVDLAQHIGIATVAEWVESEETAFLLANWGVDFLQGDAVGGPALIDGATRPPLARAG
jgi:diguanylate cyclase (GGDEF)-like protein